MPLLIGVVLMLSFLLLMVVFRSVLVPLKAVIMNLLSIGAAYGILVAIFQWGWGIELIGVDQSGPIEAWVPMFLFAIVFGLSMDYEVFLLSRIKEEYDRTKDNATAVADGLAATARVITAAALIMFCVFARLRARRRPPAQAVRPRPGHRRADRRHHRPHGPRAGDDGAARRPQLVDPQVARPDPAQHQRRGRAPHRPRAGLASSRRRGQGARARRRADPRSVRTATGRPHSRSRSDRHARHDLAPRTDQRWSSNVCTTMSPGLGALSRPCDARASPRRAGRARRRRRRARTVVSATRPAPRRRRTR